MKEPHGLAASKKLMQNYLSELLTEDPDDALSAPPKSAVNAQTNLEPKVVEKEKLDKLLQQASIAKVLNKDINTVTTVKSEGAKTAGTEKVTNKVIASPVTEPIIQVDNAPITTKKASADKNYRKGSFQAMFFDVAGLIIAVPLIELGGIHNIDKTTSLMGKPDWFKGVMLHREEKINVVDTALWVMPEKCNDQLKNSLNYQYIIMLNNSSWGLMAEHLVETVTLAQEDVKWLSQTNKRPWLAGLVKERMCALLDVESLIDLLNKGANINQQR